MFDLTRNREHALSLLRFGNFVYISRYDVALDINTVGPSRLMSFAKKCHKVELFVQISTGKKDPFACFK